MSGAVYSKVLGQKVVAGDLRLALFDIYWISDAFTWVDSPQGDLFWRRQRENNHLTPEGRRIIERALAEIEGKSTLHKYEVGDKVESVPAPEAGVGTVTEVRGEDTYRVEYSNPYYGVCTDHAENMRPHKATLGDILAAAMDAAKTADPKPSTTWGKPRRAIVARMQSGNPSPSHSPHVHADTESARNEAARLAKLNIGVEFAVLEIVSISKATAEVTTEAA